MRYLNGFSLNLMTLPEKTASFLTILLEHRNTMVPPSGGRASIRSAAENLP